MVGDVLVGFDLKFEYLFIFFLFSFGLFIPYKLLFDSFWIVIWTLTEIYGSCYTILKQFECWNDWFCLGWIKNAIKWFEFVNTQKYGLWTNIIIYYLSNIANMDQNGCHQNQTKDCIILTASALDVWSSNESTARIYNRMRIR